MAVGGGLAALSALLLALGLSIPGWIATWVLIALAGLNLFLGFCLGCFTYYQLNRLGLPGFDRSPLEGA
jgi:cytosine/uracil/thiamine/allantoin permease